MDKKTGGGDHIQFRGCKSAEKKCPSTSSTEDTPTEGRGGETGMVEMLKKKKGGRSHWVHSKKAAVNRRNELV